MSWVTRARERPSLAAIFALVIWESFSISWRQRQPGDTGEVESCSSSPESRDSETTLDNMPLEMNGIHDICSAPQRENGIARIKEWFQKVRIWFMPGEPLLKSL